MKNQLTQFMDAVRSALPTASMRVDKPEKPSGHWFLDLSLAGHEVVAEWRPNRGFGISASLEDGYGEGPDEIFTDAGEAARRVIGLLRERTHTHPPAAVLLRDLRAYSKMTQEELAKRLGIRQAAVSRMEHRKDMTISTLQRVVQAMGGHLQIAVAFPNETLKLSQFDTDDSAPV